MPDRIQSAVVTVAVETSSRRDLTPKTLPFRRASEGWPLCRALRSRRSGGFSAGGFSVGIRSPKVFSSPSKGVWRLKPTISNQETTSPACSAHLRRGRGGGIKEVGGEEGGRLRRWARACSDPLLLSQIGKSGAG